MPRTYIRKNMRKQWTADAMAAVRNKEMGFLKASKTFDVPKATLERKVKCIDTPLSEVVNVPLGRKPTLPPHIEADLVSYIIEMEARLFGLTCTDVRRMAYQLAKINNIKTNFNINNEIAGKDWLTSFLSRHPELSLRSPESTSAARATAFNKVNVGKFFDLLEKEVDFKKFKANQIYNVDEKGITTVQSNNAKIIALKGKKQIGVLSSAERGRTVTTVICMSAAGDYIPPMFIFPRQRMKMELMDGAPPGSIYACHKTGWIQLDLFTQWLQHFINFVKPSQLNPALIVLDGHASHTKNLDAINLARQNHITMICLPPHCTHRMQPLDVSFMKPLTTYYDSEIQVWLRSHPGRVITEFQIASIFAKAYLRAASLATAVNGFEKTGIWPVNRNIFQDWEYKAAETTDMQVAPASNEILEQEINSAMDLPSTSRSSILELGDQEPLNKSWGPADISPFPVANCERDQGKGKGRRKGCTAVLTSSPYKQTLGEPSTSKCVRTNQDKAKKTKGKSSNVDDDDTPCIYCNGLFSEDRHGEKWIQCVACSKWAHTECAGAESSIFECDLCVESD